MKRILAIAVPFAALFAGVLSAQDVVATWQGSIQAGAEWHRAVLQMSKTDKGEWKPKNFYIEFFPEEIHIASAQANARHLRFSTDNGKGSFQGTISTDGDQINGSWRYDKSASTIELKKIESARAWPVPFLYQYHYKDVTYYRPSPDEPKIPFSAKLALTYLEQGATAWTAEWHCVACHTNGSYMVVRPMLTSRFGAPQKELHDYFVTALQEQMAADPSDPKRQPEPTQVVYIAAGTGDLGCQRDACSFSRDR